MREAIAFILLMTGMGLLIEVATSTTPSAWRTVFGFAFITTATAVGFWGK